MILPRMAFLTKIYVIVQASRHVWAGTADEAEQDDFDFVAGKLHADLSVFTDEELRYYRENFYRHMRDVDFLPESAFHDINTHDDDHHRNGPLLHMRKVEVLSPVEQRVFAIFREAEPMITAHKVQLLSKEVASNDANGRMKWVPEESSRFRGWSIRDVKKLMGTFVGKDAKTLTESYDESSMTVQASDLPTNFDSREKWGNICPSVVTVRDQATCGSCWAFGSTEAFNDRSCIASGGTMKTLLSTEHTLSCCGLVPCYSMGCHGGHPGLAWWWLTHFGIVSGGLYGDTETCWPYEIKPCSHHVPDPDLPPCDGMDRTPTCKSSCTNAAYPNPFKQDRHTGKRAYMIKGRDAIKENIFKFGPVTSAFLVMSDFPAYKSGVYAPSGSAKPLGGHAIKIVGWGVEDGEDYWLVANSWNTNWGDKGYFKIKMGACGIDLGVSAGEINHGVSTTPLLPMGGTIQGKQETSAETKYLLNATEQTFYI